MSCHSRGNAMLLNPITLVRWPSRREVAPGRDFVRLVDLNLAAGRPPLRMGARFVSRPAGVQNSLPRIERLCEFGAALNAANSHQAKEQVRREPVLTDLALED